jgi:ferrochelatase
MAYGTPDSLDAVEPYYTDILRGRKPPPDLLEELLERYRVVGGRTPLLDISRAQAAALQANLGPGYRVFLGMKHWHPYVFDTVAEMQGAGIRRAVGIVLAPHYSRGSIGEYVDRVQSAKQALEYDLEIDVVPSWHLNPHYLDAVEGHAHEALAEWRAGSVPRGEHQELTPAAAPHVVFTAHSLPVRVVSEGDPYQRQLIETSEALARRLGLDDGGWSFSYQSAGRTADPWLGPDLLETVNRLAGEGETGILVVPIGFISDHLEILFDIDHEARGAAARLGIRFERMQSLNDDSRLVDALADESSRAVVRLLS